MNICEALKNIGENLAAAGYYNLNVFIDDLKNSFSQQSYNLDNKYRRVVLACLITSRKFIKENIDECICIIRYGYLTKKNTEPNLKPIHPIPQKTWLVSLGKKLFIYGYDIDRFLVYLQRYFNGGLKYSSFKSCFDDIPDFPSDEDFTSISSKYQYSAAEHLKYGYTCYSLFEKNSKSNKLDSTNLLKINAFYALLRMQLNKDNKWYLIGFNARNTSINNFDRYMKSHGFEHDGELQDAWCGYYDCFLFKKISKISKNENKDFFAILEDIVNIGKNGTVSNDERVLFFQAIKDILHLPYEDRYLKYRNIRHSFPNCSQLFQFNGGVFNKALGTDSYVYDTSYLPIKVLLEQCEGLLRKLAIIGSNVTDFLDDLKTLFFSIDNENRKLFFQKYCLEESNDLIFVLKKIHFNNRFKQLFIRAFDDPQFTDVNSPVNARS